MTDQPIVSEASDDELAVHPDPDATIEGTEGAPIPEPTDEDGEIL